MNIVSNIHFTIPIPEEITWTPVVTILTKLELAALTGLSTVGMTTQTSDTSKKSGCVSVGITGVMLFVNLINPIIARKTFADADVNLWIFLILYPLKSVETDQRYQK